jgi:hypothetical protein
MNKEPVYTTDGVIIAQSMYEFLNSWPDKPVIICLDTLDKTAMSMMFQPLTDAKKTRGYVNGSYLGAWSFAVYVRTTNADTKGRLDARKILHSIDEWFLAKNDDGQYINLPALTQGNTAEKIEMTSTPAIAARYDNGVDDYQAVYTLTFKHKEEQFNA